jgi:hypothetical protein
LTPISGASVRTESGSADLRLMIDDFMSPAVLEFTAVPGNTSSSSASNDFTIVYAIPPYAPDRATWFKLCQSLVRGSRTADINGWPAYRYQCTLQPPGCGGHLQFLAHSCTPSQDCQYSLASEKKGPRSEFWFPSTTITEKTLRFHYNDTGSDALTAPLDSSAAFEIYFNGTNFCPIEWLRTITYGPASERTRFVCYPTGRLWESNVMSCKTSPSSYGLGNSFTVFVGTNTELAVSVTGTDVLHYIGSEEYPVITGVTGCGGTSINNATTGLFFHSHIALFQHNDAEYVFDSNG